MSQAWPVACGGAVLPNLSRAREGRLCSQMQPHIVQRRCGRKLSSYTTLPVQPFWKLSPALASERSNLRCQASGLYGWL